jgi:hypothetical protein
LYYRCVGTFTILAVDKIVVVVVVDDDGEESVGEADEGPRSRYKAAGATVAAADVR